MKKIKGLSLLELLVVLAIITIISAMAIDYYSDYIKKAEVARYTKLTNNLKSEVIEDYFNGLDYPDLNKYVDNYNLYNRSYSVHIYADNHGIIREVISDNNDKYLRKLVYFPTIYKNTTVKWVCEAFGFDGVMSDSCISKLKNDSEVIPNNLI